MPWMSCTGPVIYTNLFTLPQQCVYICLFIHSFSLLPSVLATFSSPILPFIINPFPFAFSTRWFPPCLHVSFSSLSTCSPSQTCPSFYHLFFCLPHTFSWYGVASSSDLLFAQKIVTSHLSHKVLPERDQSTWILLWKHFCWTFMVFLPHTPLCIVYREAALSLLFPSICSSPSAHLMFLPLSPLSHSVRPFPSYHYPPVAQGSSATPKATLLFNSFLSVSPCNVYAIRPCPMAVWPSSPWWIWRTPVHTQPPSASHIRLPSRPDTLFPWYNCSSTPHQLWSLTLDF